MNKLLRRHVDLFNAGVRSGDFGEMVDQFTADGQLVFEGVPVGPFRTRQAIAAAYRERPPPVVSPSPPYASYVKVRM